MSKKKDNAPEFALSAVGVWAKGKVDVWTLQEDTRFSIYEGQTKGTRGQWFMVQRKPSDYMMFRMTSDINIPSLLGRAKDVVEALDLADAEISLRRSQPPSKVTFTNDTPDDVVLQTTVKL